MYNADEASLILLLAGGGACSLDSSPGKNWVEKSGGLPNYICNIAKDIMGKGKSKSMAIAIAISTVKRWAAGGKDVKPDTRVKAAAAVAQWEALRAKNAARKIKLGHNSEGQSYVFFSNIPSYNTSIVNMAWDMLERARQQAWEDAIKAGNKDPDNDGDDDAAEEASESPSDGDKRYDSRWVKEVWTDYIIVQNMFSSGQVLTKIPFTVDADTYEISFGTEVPVHVEYVEDDGALSKHEMDMISEMLEMTSAVDGLIALTSLKQ